MMDTHDYGEEGDSRGIEHEEAEHLLKVIEGRGRGIFLVFEGLDGSGTTTQMELLAKDLREEGLKVITTCEPTESPIGKAIDEILKGGMKIDNKSMMTLFALDRKEHVKEIEGWLKEGYIVICDRYYISSFTYQGMNAPEEERLLMHVLNKDFLKPDLTIYIDALVDTCMGRIESRAEERELFEKRETLECVEAEYQKYGDDMYYVDGDGTVDDVSEEVRYALWTIA